MKQLIPPPLTLYIHFPWCVKKCPYCDFNSHVLHSGFDEDAYIDCLIADLQYDVVKVWGRTIHAVFMGGGTPSLFSAAAIERLLNAVRMLLPCQPGMEVTMEVNPGTGEYDNFIGYRQAGVNRLSIGIQSLKDENLKVLGRIHSSKQAVHVYQQARNAGFENINLDMMFALPKQTLEDANDDLQQLIDLAPDHLSYYQLTIEPNTLFAVKTPKHLPESTQLDEMYHQGVELLAQNGYQQYEVSAYAKDNKMCQHNINYWQFGDYLGIGAGAHSKITDAAKKTVTRYMKYKLPRKYIDNSDSYTQEIRELRATDLMFEYMLNAVRLKKSIKLKNFSAYTGLDSSQLLQKLKFAIQMKWVINQQDRLIITPKGFLLSDEIVKILL